MQILINVPARHVLGGVRNHYDGIREHLGDNVHYNEVGHRQHIPAFLALPYDFLRFFWLCLSKDYDCVVLNPSLQIWALRRDWMFLWLAKACGKPTVVFIHGWDPEMENQLETMSFSESLWLC